MKGTSYQAVVAQYHVESSDDEQNGDHAHEKDGLMTYHQQQSEKWHQPLWGESHQSFAMNGPRLWNALPKHITLAQNVYQFKMMLKSYLFKIPDTPPTTGYTSCNDISNSIINYVNFGCLQ